jgi:hypothetical protein
VVRDALAAQAPAALRAAADGLAELVIGATVSQEEACVRH